MLDKIRTAIVTLFRRPQASHPADPATGSELPAVIIFDSPELACLHEAGHAQTALSVGARVVEIELYRASPRSYGRTRAERTAAQKRHIALGGFAVEYLLYRAGRLVKQDGSPPLEKEFIDYAMGNAADDLKSFFDVMTPPVAGHRDEDETFMSCAIGRAENEMDFVMVERLALALLAKGKLDEEAVARLSQPRS